MDTAPIIKQQYPDNQKGPLGEKQRAWVDEHYGCAFFREAKPMVDQHQQIIVHTGSA